MVRGYNACTRMHLCMPRTNPRTIEQFQKFKFSKSVSCPKLVAIEFLGIYKPYVTEEQREREREEERKITLQP